MGTFAWTFYPKKACKYRNDRNLCQRQTDRQTDRQLAIAEGSAWKRNAVVCIMAYHSGFASSRLYYKCLGCSVPKLLSGTLDDSTSRRVETS